MATDAEKASREYLEQKQNAKKRAGKGADETKQC